MIKRFKILEDVPTQPIPLYGQGYVLRPLPKQFNPTQEALQTIKTEVQKFKTSKSEDPDGYMKNISISIHSEGKGKKLQQVYNFKIKAKDDPDYYKGHVFEGRIQFPDNYPHEPPRVLMNYLSNGKPLQMVNLYGDGAVCHHTISEDYYKYPKFDLPYILSEIEGLLYRPNPNDPANGLLGEYFIKYPNTYWKFQREQAKLLPLAKE